MSDQENKEVPGMVGVPPDHRLVFALTITPGGEPTIIMNGQARQILDLLVQAIETVRMQSIKDMLQGLGQGRRIQVAGAGAVPPNIRGKGH